MMAFFMLPVILFSSDSYSSNQKIKKGSNDIFFNEITLESDGGGGGYCNQDFWSTYSANGYAGKIDPLLSCKNEPGAVDYDPSAGSIFRIFSNGIHFSPKSKSYSGFIFTDQDVSFKMRAPEVYCGVQNIKKNVLEKGSISKDSLRFIRKRGPYDREYGVLSMEAFATFSDASGGGRVEAEVTFSPFSYRSKEKDLSASLYYLTLSGSWERLSPIEVDYVPHLTSEKVIDSCFDSKKLPYRHHKVQAKWQLPYPTLIRFILGIENKNNEYLVHDVKVKVEKCLPDASGNSICI